MTVQPTRDQLRALADKATPGPWEIDKDWAAMSSGSDSVFHAYTEHPECEFCGEGADGEAKVAIGYEDAVFIAAARTAVPQLLDALDQTEAERDAARGYISELETAVQSRNDVIKHRDTRIQAVRDIHTGTVWPGVADKPICDACDKTWPCPTIRALD